MGNQQNAMNKRKLKIERVMLQTEMSITAAKAIRKNYSFVQTFSLADLVFKALDKHLKSSFRNVKKPSLVRCEGNS